MAPLFTGLSLAQRIPRTADALQICRLIAVVRVQVIDNADNPGDLVCEFAQLH